ncbi:adenylyl cyclase [Kitasatospora sp. NPDC057500]|uniref:adenylyl cyclase n=1 Tax=Kitasatospora sp. NPDC057500 TaxID=3346151 RepID=UPI003676D64F
MLRRLEGAYRPGRVEAHRDTYDDTTDGQIAATDRELRISGVTGADGGRTALLTHKDARADEASGTGPEHETRMADGEAAHAIVRGLGHRPALSLEKRCRNYAFERDGRPALASLVRVSEPEGVFPDVGTAEADGRELPAALAAVRAVLTGPGVPGGGSGHRAPHRGRRCGKRPATPTLTVRHSLWSASPCFQ